MHFGAESQIFRPPKGSLLGGLRPEVSLPSFGLNSQKQEPLFRHSDENFQYTVKNPGGGILLLLFERKFVKIQTDVIVKNVTISTPQISS